MLTHPTLDRLTQLGLLGMAVLLGDMIDAARLRYAKPRHQATGEDVDYRAVRGLDQALFQIHRAARRSAAQR